MKKLVAMTLAMLMLASCLTACGSSSSSSTTKKDALYSTIYDAETDASVMENLPSNQFLPMDVSSLLEDGSMRLEVTLEIESSRDYTLIVDFYDSEQGEEDDGEAYIFYEYCVVGSYTMDGDTITLGAPDMGQITLTVGGIYEEYGLYSFLSPVDGELEGVWTEEDVPELLDTCPGAVFTVDGSSIVTWTVSE